MTFSTVIITIIITGKMSSSIIIDCMENRVWSTVFGVFKYNCRYLWLWKARHFIFPPRGEREWSQDDGEVCSTQITKYAVRLENDFVRRSIYTVHEHDMEQTNFPFENHENKFCEFTSKTLTGVSIARYIYICIWK